MSTLENERLDRIEQHLKNLKLNDEKQGDLLLKIEDALVGSQMNGNKGIVYLVSDIDARLKVLEQREALNDESIKNIKWLSRAIGTSIIAFFLWFFTKK
jgi:hypothetical protein